MEKEFFLSYGLTTHNLKNETIVIVGLAKKEGFKISLTQQQCEVLHVLMESSTTREIINKIAEAGFLFYSYKNKNKGG
jgi:pheromone shutdown protein TraB